jgi:hypothetical protein
MWRGVVKGSLEYDIKERYTGPWATSTYVLMWVLDSDDPRTSWCIQPKGKEEESFLLFTLDYIPGISCFFFCTRGCIPNFKRNRFKRGSGNEFQTSSINL